MADNKSICEAIATADAGRCKKNFNDHDGKLAEAVSKLDRPITSPFDQENQ